jgi:hypothetical protein
MMEAARTSEKSVDIQLRTRQYIPVDSELHTRRRENLKSHVWGLSLTWVWRVSSGVVRRVVWQKLGDDSEELLMEAPHKSRSTSVRLHGATSQDWVIFVVAAENLKSRISSTLNYSRYIKNFISCTTSLHNNYKIQNFVRCRMLFDTYRTICYLMVRIKISRHCARIELSFKAEARLNNI